VNWQTSVQSSDTDVLVHVGVHCLLSSLCFWHCWLGVRKSIQPVKNWVMGCWRGYLSGMWCKWFAYGPSDATATHHQSLASVKSRMVYLSGACLPRLSWKKAVKRMCVSRLCVDQILLYYKIASSTYWFHYSRVTLYQHSERSAYGTEHSPEPSVGLLVCLSAKCIVVKRLIGSGCRLGWWMGSVDEWVY